MTLRQIVLGLVLSIVVAAAAPTCSGQTAAAQSPAAAATQPNPADVERAVALICPQSDITRAKDGRVDGCKTCPEGTDFSGENNMSWGLYHVTAGHFTSPKDDNLLLDGSGCDSHASNFGGSFLFSLKAGQPRLLKYDQGLATSRCNKASYPDGRDFLVCQSGWTGQGYTIENVLVSGFNAAGKDVTTNVLRVTDTTGTCLDDPSTVVQDADITDIKFSNKESGELTGMTVTATLGHVKCSQVSPTNKSNTPLPSGKTYLIQFLFDGKQFKVAPASRTAFNALQATN